MASPGPNPARSALPTLASFALCASLAGCSGASSVGTQPGPPTTGQISVAVTPSTASVLLGNTLALSAAVANSTNTSVTWDVSGVTGGNSVLGIHIAGWRLYGAGGSANALNDYHHRDQRRRLIQEGDDNDYCHERHYRRNLASVVDNRIGGATRFSSEYRFGRSAQ